MCFIVLLLIVLAQEEEIGGSSPLLLIDGKKFDETIKEGNFLFVFL
jgi:hypothetical protein